MIFTVTERGSFRRCPRQCYLTSKNGLHLTPSKTPLHFEVGSLVHRAHQLWLENPDVPMEKLVLDASLELTDKVRARYKRKVGVYPSTSEISTTYESVELAMAMCVNYQIKWHTPLPDHYKLIDAEQKIEVPVPATRHRCLACDGSNQDCPSCGGTGEEVHVLQGRLDGMLEHSSGRIDVLECKTYNTRPKVESLSHNDQFLAYAWMVWKLGITDSLPVVAYDGLWKRATPPRGRTFDDLFTRVQVTRSLAEFEEFEHFLPVRLNQMAAMYRNPDHLAEPNRRWEGCWDCKVEPICTAMSRNEDVVNTISASFEERTDDVDEPEGVDE